LLKIGAGELAEKPSQIVKVLRLWLNDEDRLNEIGKAAIAHSKPKAALDAAEIIYKVANGNKL